MRQVFSAQPQSARALYVAAPSVSMKPARHARATYRSMRWPNAGSAERLGECGEVQPTIEEAQYTRRGVWRRCGETPVNDAYAGGIEPHAPRSLGWQPQRRADDGFDWPDMADQRDHGASMPLSQGCRARAAALAEQRQALAVWRSVACATLPFRMEQRVARLRLSAGQPLPGAIVLLAQPLLDLRRCLGRAPGAQPRRRVTRAAQRAGIERIQRRQ